MENLYSIIMYNLIIILASILASLSKKSQKAVPFSLLLSFLILTVPVGIRYYVGADFGNYVNIYNRIEYGGIFDDGLESLELGYKMLNYLCSIVFDDVQAVFFITAVLTNVFVYKAIKDQVREFSGLATFTFGFTLYVWEFIQIRNMLAIAIFFYSLKYLIINKKLKYFLFISIAFLFHYSAFVYYIFPFLFSPQSNRKNIKIGIASILLSPLLLYIINYLSSYIVIAFPKYYKYSGQFNNIKMVLSPYVIIMSLPIIPMFLRYKKMIELNKNIDIYMSLYLISISLLLYVGSIPLISRFIYALWSPLLVIFPTLIHTFSQKSDYTERFIVRSSLIFILVVYGLVIFNFYLVQDSYFLLPYQSFLNK